MQIIYSDNQANNVIRFSDGTVIYVTEIQYSPNGTTYWETSYNPNPHKYEGDGVTDVEGHKYMRVKHSNKSTWELPMYITAVDGKDVLLRKNGDNVEWAKDEDTPTWNILYDLNDYKLQFSDFTPSEKDEIKGDQGIQGIQGEKGDKLNHYWSGTQLAFENPDGTVGTYTELKGEMGKGLEINLVGALDTRPSYPSCESCNNTNSTTIGAIFMSAGNHIITQEDVLDGSTYWHYVNSTWTQTTEDHIGTYVIAWQATDGTGTAAISVNDLGQTLEPAPSPTTYDSTGTLWVWTSDNVWVELDGIAQPSGLIKVSSADVLGFLETKMDNDTLEAYDSGVGYTSKLRIKDEGVDENKIIDSSLGDGLEGGSGTVLSVNPSDFVGDESFGLETFTHTTDTTTDIRFKTSDLEGDGLNVESGTNKLEVDVTDLIISTTDGLTTYTAGDSKNNLRVLLDSNSGLTLESTGIKANPDDLTLTTTTNTLKVLETDSLTLGIQAKHIHSNVVDTNKGLQKADNTVGALEVKLDGSSLVFDGGNIAVNTDGIEGTHLNSNTCDTNRGVEIFNDKIATKVDTTTIGYNGTGYLELVDDAVTSAKIDDDTVVRSVNGEQDVITLTSTDTTHITTSVTTTAGNVDIESTLDIQDGYIQESMIDNSQIVKTLNSFTDAVNIIPLAGSISPVSILVTTESNEIRLDTFIDYAALLTPANIPVQVIEPQHINSTTFLNGTTNGLEWDNTEGLKVLVDDTTIEINASNQLTVKPTSIIIPEDAAVTSITAGGTTVENDVTLSFTSGATGAINTSITANAVSESIELNVDIQESWFDARYAPIDSIPSIDPITIGDVDGLQAALDLKVDKDIQYGNIKIVTTGGNEGLYIESNGGDWFKITVDNAGNLDTTAV